jgi:hypothetical protein
MRQVVRVYDSKAKVKILTLIFDTQHITALAWRPETTDGTFLAVGDEEGKVTVVDLLTAERSEVEVGGAVTALLWDWDSSLLFACSDLTLTMINLRSLEVALIVLPITPSHLALDPFGLSSIVAYEAETSALVLVLMEPEITVKPVALALELIQVEFCPWAAESLLVLTKDSLLLYSTKTEQLSLLISSSMASHSQLVLSRSTNTALVILHTDSSIALWTGFSEAEAKIASLDCVFKSKCLLGPCQASAFQGAFALDGNCLGLGLMANAKVYLFDLELPQMRSDLAQLRLTQTYDFDFSPTSVVCSLTGVYYNPTELLVLSPSTSEVSHRRKFPFVLQKVLKASDKLLLLTAASELYEYSLNTGVYKLQLTFDEAVLDFAVNSKYIAVLRTQQLYLLRRRTYETLSITEFTGDASAVAFLEDGSVAVSLDYGVWVCRPGGSDGGLMGNRPTKPKISQPSSSPPDALSSPQIGIDGTLISDDYCIETRLPYKRMVFAPSGHLLLGFDGTLFDLSNPASDIASEVLDVCPVSCKPFYAHLQAEPGIFTHSSVSCPALLPAASQRYLRTLLTMTQVADIDRSLEDKELPRELRSCLPYLKSTWLRHVKDDDDLFTRLLSYAKLIGSRREQRFWTLAYQSCHDLMMRQLEPRPVASTQSLHARALGEPNMSTKTFREYETPTKYNKSRVVTPTPGRTRKTTRLRTVTKPKAKENYLHRDVSKRTRSMQNSPFDFDSKKRSLSPMVRRDLPTVKKVKREVMAADNTDTLLQLAVNTSNLLLAKSDGKLTTSVRNSMTYFYSNPRKENETESRMEKLKSLLVPHPQVVLRVYKACTIAGSISSSAYYDTLQQGARLLEETGLHEEAAELLFLSGKGLEACLSLQNAGLWNVASKAKIAIEDLSLVNIRWAQHLMTQGRTSLALEVALSSLQFNRVIQLLELLGLDDLAFSFACFLESRRVIQRSHWHKAAEPFVSLFKTSLAADRACTPSSSGADLQGELSHEMTEGLKSAAVLKEVYAVFTRACCYAGHSLHTEHTEDFCACYGRSGKEGARTDEETLAAELGVAKGALKRVGAADYAGPHTSQSLLRLKSEFRQRLTGFPWLISRVF